MKIKSTKSYAERRALQHKIGLVKIREDEIKQFNREQRKSRNKKTIN